MNWFISSAQLNAEQRRTLQSLLAPGIITHWLMGYAGTGKTLVLTHALREIVRRTDDNTTIGYLAFTHALKELVYSGLEDEEDRVEIRTVSDFFANPKHYDILIVDEIQDVEAKILPVIKQNCGRLIIAGDPAQSIYPARPKPAVISKLLGGTRKHVLTEVPRLNAKTLLLSKSINPAGLSPVGKATGEGRGAIVITGQTEEKVAIATWKQALKVARPGHPAAILLPTHTLIHDFASHVAKSQGLASPPERKQPNIGGYNNFNRFFASKGTPLMFFGSDSGDLAKTDRSKLVLIMTYHSAKGLDFDHVFLPGLHTEARLDAKPKPLSKIAQERILFFVAATRAKLQLYLSYHGKPHKLVADLPPSCLA